MASNFFSQEEACAKLAISPEELKAMVQSGQLRELRDGGKVMYKAADVEGLAAERGGATPAVAGSDDSGDSGLGGSFSDLDLLSTAELTLEDSSAKTSGDSVELKFVEDDPAPKQDAPPDLSGAGASASAPGLSFGATDSLTLDDDTGHPGGSASDASGTGELVLEPAEDDKGGSDLGLGSSIDLGTGLDLSGTDLDAVSLDDTTASETEDEKEGTVVSSIGVSVFDDDEVEEAADPLAQTVMSGGSGAEALGIDNVGSGSGLLDLTRESDDTSLGAELLDEIYSDESGSGDPMGESTRAGMVEDLPEASEASSVAAVPAVIAAAAAPVAVARTTTQLEFAPDALSKGLTGMLFVGVLVMCVAGLAVAAAAQDVWPALMETLAGNNLIVGGASAGAALIALGVGYMVGKRGG